MVTNKHPSAVKNAGKLGDGRSRAQREIEEGKRCARCEILIFDSIDDAKDNGVSNPNDSIIAVRGDKNLCSECAK